jgi:hypothetical protein
MVRVAINPSLAFSIWRVKKADQAVLAPAGVVEFGTDRIQLSPSNGQLDAIRRNTPAYQSFFDPVRSSLGECEIVNQVAS